MDIGRLEKLDLRYLWQREATEFTPWLAKEENIQLLSDAIGIKLEVQSQEESVGAFRADILCKDLMDDHYVLIENQLERTDHTHLGQLMTYAAGLDAVTIIWIAQKFTEEHRAALDWLNSITDETINFFGIEIEVYKIGDSLPAPMFNIVSKPNDWSKQVRKSTEAANLSGIKLFKMEYWQGLKEFMEEHKSTVKMRNPQAQHWSDISIGKSDIYVTAAMFSRTNTIEIWLVIRGQQAKQNFDKLYEIAYNVSLKEIDGNIIWDRMEELSRCGVILRRKADFADKNDWSNQFLWFKENLEKYVQFFKPLITKI
jgi:hypothetical protein